MFSLISIDETNTGRSAVIDFPRILPGHESAAELLIEKAFSTLRRKGITRITGRVTTMCPGDVKLAEKTGFKMFDWGYKVYYSYEMKWGKARIRITPTDRTTARVPRPRLPTSQNATAWTIGTTKPRACEVMHNRLAAITAARLGQVRS